MWSTGHLEPGEWTRFMASFLSRQASVPVERSISPFLAIVRIRQEVYDSDLAGAAKNRRRFTKNST